ncbi:hypothetical protein D5071_14425 [Pectobacterium carotovorum]|uniref:Uncharacterized protein n=2 Tax=Pectobacterium carotovorum TaxID=554 RepID=A0A419AU96_PECCA|nr:hypothetical protein D5071_14425 [Pectobacterium carotovorum]
MHADGFNILMRDNVQDLLAEAGWPEMEITYSLSHSQGDGVAFYGSLHAGEMAELFTALLHQGYLTNREANTFTKLVTHYDMTLRLTRNDFGLRYAHANCINIDFYDIDAPDRYPRCCQRIFTAVKRSVHDICSMAESQGYDLLDDLANADLADALH